MQGKISNGHNLFDRLWCFSLFKIIKYAENLAINEEKHIQLCIASMIINNFTLYNRIVLKKFESSLSNSSKYLSTITHM